MPQIHLPCNKGLKMSLIVNIILKIIKTEVTKLLSN